MRLDSVTADPTAAWQGNQFDFDIANNILDLQLCNSTHLRFEPVLPAAIVSGPVATLYGWEWMLANGWVFGIGDAQGTKIEGLLDSFGLAGMQIYFIVPIADIPLNGDFRVERLREMDGTWGNYQFTDQCECPVDSKRVFPWVDHSLAGYFADKRNVNSADPNGRFMSGKFLHEPPPLAYPFKVTGPLVAGTMANRAKAGGGSETIGRWGLLSDGKEKVFDCATTHGNMGNGTHVAFAATLGNTTMGLTGQGNLNFLLANGNNTAPEAGTISAIVLGNEASGLEPDWVIYNGDDLLYSALNTPRSSSAADSGSFWLTLSGLSVVMANGADIHPGGNHNSSSADWMYDVGVSGDVVYKAHTFNTAYPDPITWSTLNLNMSMYVIYEAIGPGPGGAAGVLAGLGVGRIGGMMGG
jgi:hypothetical protein